MADPLTSSTTPAAMTGVPTSRAPASTLPDGYGPRSRWLDRRLPVISLLRREYVVYPTPRNLNYLWNFGALATVALAMLILTGIFLAIAYTPTAAGAFASVEAIDRQVGSGWVIRSTHMAGASMVFAALYVHTFRSLYYGSYKEPREVLWLTGMLLLVMMMVTAFAGYVLPWGQMSYWGASVVSGAISSLPGIGHPLAVWLQGGDTIGDVTLHRYYALHFVLGFLILGAVVLHVVALHVTGSSNPLGIEVKGPQDTLPFHPYYTSKDSDRRRAVPDRLRGAGVLPAGLADPARQLHRGQPVLDAGRHHPGMVFRAVLRRAACGAVAARWPAAVVGLRCWCCSRCPGSTPRRCTARGSGRSIASP